MEQPRLIEVVVLGRLMQSLAIIPHDDIARSPSIAVDELRLSRVFSEIVDELDAIFGRHADEALNT